jgi:hypothetical protein
VWLGVASLGFLVVVHKLEYFLNARIVGGRTNVPTYAMLASMLVLEAAFGLGGLVAAPGLRGVAHARAARGRLDLIAQRASSCALVAVQPTMRPAPDHLHRRLLELREVALGAILSSRLS